jgi:7-carboxy-7-deazaguanine synthase
VVKRLLTDLQITEIFKSIQGESSYAGLPCSFIRTTGCNLRCVWCDTEYAFYGGKQMSIPEIMAAIEPHGCELVEITGGEPLLQDDVSPLASELMKRNHTVLVETGGALDISKLPPGVIRIMDVKCPDSGMSEKMDWENLNHLQPKDEIRKGKGVSGKKRSFVFASLSEDETGTAG